MQSGICPKCGSDEVYDDSSKSMFGKGERDYLHISANSTVTLRNYVCIVCGYAESYVEDVEKLHEIQVKWNRTPKRKRKNDE